MRTLLFASIAATFLAVHAHAQNAGERVIVVGTRTRLTDGNNVASLSRGTHLEVVQVKDSKLLVHSDGRKGWINSQDVIPYALGIEYFTKAIDEKPTAADYCARGNLWRTTDKALLDFNEAIRLDPKHGAAYLNRSNIWRAKGSPDRAMEDLNEAIRADPASYRAYLSRGILSADKGDVETALADFNESIRLNPLGAPAHNSRGILWSKSDFDKALADFNECIRLDPKDTKAYRNRARLLSDRGEFDKAIKDFDEAIRLEPRNSKGYAGRGRVWYGKKDLDKAIADYNESIILDARDAFAYLDRGLAWREKGEFDKAIEDFTQAMRLNPKDGDAPLERASVWIRKNDPQKAIEDFTEAIRLSPRKAYSYNAIARIYAAHPEDKIRDGRKALEHATRACELTGWKVPAYLVTLAAAFAETGDFEKAVEWQERAVGLAPEDKKDSYRQLLTLFKEKTPFRAPLKSTE